MKTGKMGESVEKKAPKKTTRKSPTKAKAAKTTRTASKPKAGSASTAAKTRSVSAGKTAAEAPPKSKTETAPAESPKETPAPQTASLKIPAAPVESAPDRVESPKSESLKPAPPKPEAPKSVPPKSEVLRTEPPKPEAAKPEPQKAVSSTETAKAAPNASASTPSLKALQLQTPITVRELAVAIEAKPTELIAKLIQAGVFASMNQSIPFDAAAKLAAEFGYKIEAFHELEHDLSKIHHSDVDREKLVVRPPIVTLMGHVDHGKTSLLDAIRKSKVVESESGGITQHIGAYEVFLPKGAVTFLDTPGHEAFTAMRSRGARATDIVVLVVAADSGIMPQTEEAIHHAKAAEATIVVAINKCDLPAANVDRVKKELAERDLAPEDWGGKTITVSVSAKTGQGIDELLEMLLLESEVLELRANPEAPARGTVVEAELSKGKGPIATFLVQDGTLRLSDTVVCGTYSGRVKAMVNDRGQRIKEAPPSTPVEVLGLSGVPQAGDVFYVVKNEVKARELIEEKRQSLLERSRSGPAHITLEQLHEQIQAGKINTLNLIVKADVQGSLEALIATLSKIEEKEVKLNIIHSGTGDISASDVMLASASNAIVIGFHVAVAADAEALRRREEVDVRVYEIIYELKTAILKALEGLLEPEEKEISVGKARVRQVFRVSKIGAVAGSKVEKGKIVRNARCRVFRDGKIVFEGRIGGLKRFKNDAREVAEGFECGITVDGFADFEEGDEIKAYTVETQARTFSS
ncbi:MAG: translation initiation factor IF-2 [Candidatus Omnitrophica bacterium]|nr:translation initiation factor IF-2 [Candidatus Omnitrophota bacterium]